MLRSGEREVEVEEAEVSTAVTSRSTRLSVKSGIDRPSVSDV